MPALKPPPMPAIPFESAPPAPHLTTDNLCSECRVRPMPLHKGEMKVCPVCYALLWHEDWASAERKRKRELADQRAAVEQARRDAKRQQQREVAEERKQIRMRLIAERIGAITEPDPEHKL